MFPEKFRFTFLVSFAGGGEKGEATSKIPRWGSDRLWEVGAGASTALSHAKRPSASFGPQFPHLEKTGL